MNESNDLIRTLNLAQRVLADAEKYQPEYISELCEIIERLAASVPGRKSPPLNTDTLRATIQRRRDDHLAKSHSASHTTNAHIYEHAKAVALSDVLGLLESPSAWTNFREQRPGDGESYEFLWVEHYGTKRREIGTFSDVDGWIWVGGNGINPREKKAVFYRELVESPTSAEIEAATRRSDAK